MEELLKKTGYSNKAILYFKNKKNVGMIEKPTVMATYTGKCGDTMKFYLKINSTKVITDAKFEAVGCAGAFTAGSALMEILKNISVSDAKKICEYDIIKHLGKVPDKKLDCIYLAIKTLDKTLSKYNNIKRAK